jgi:uncharacterized protein
MRRAFSSRKTASISELDLFPQKEEQKKFISGYTAKGFFVNKEYYEEPLLIFPRAIFKWKITAPKLLDIASYSFLNLFSPSPSMKYLKPNSQRNRQGTLLLGTGDQFSMNIDFMRGFKEKGFNIEIMNSVRFWIHFPC